MEKTKINSHHELHFVFLSMSCNSGYVLVSQEWVKEGKLVDKETVEMQA